MKKYEKIRISHVYNIKPNRILGQLMYKCTSI